TGTILGGGIAEFQIFVNGQLAFTDPDTLAILGGTSFSETHSFDIGAFLREGSNTIEYQVTPTAGSFDTVQQTASDILTINYTPMNSCVCPNCCAGFICQSGECVVQMNGCTSNSQCPSGYVCDSGTCVPSSMGCTSNSQCQTGYICQNGVCVPSGTMCPAGSFNLGGSCLSSGFVGLVGILTVVGIGGAAVALRRKQTPTSTPQSRPLIQKAPSAKKSSRRKKKT